jgi:hypothetical protein
LNPRFPHLVERRRPVAQSVARLLGLMGFARVLLGSTAAHAQASPPAPHEDAAFDIMNVLDHAGLHDIRQEAWNVYGQFTYISSWKLPFSAPYTNANGSTHSLLPDSERSFTGSFTLFFGLRLWEGAEAFVVPEVIAERPLSGLFGLGGSIQNFELQKTGSETPQLYRSRTYLRQTFNFGGDRVEKTSQPMQLGSVVDGRRLVVTAGNFSILDVFDRNTVNFDPRRTLFNMAFMTHASWDFPSDARGYSWGATVEGYWDDWAVRIGRITPPQTPNQLATDFRIWQYYGDQIELEHDHSVLGLPGLVQVLGYRNDVYSGRFDDAIAALEANPRQFNAAATSMPSAANPNAPACPGNYGSGNFTAPDVCWVRRSNVKVGAGFKIEQNFAEDAGVFVRGMYSDGQSEVDAFNSADRSFAAGVVAKGATWHRPFDVAGAAFGMSWISDDHARYLALGGVDGFVGDGHLHQAGEGVVETFYSVNLLKAIWLSGDYQFIWNPGFNSDRGPAHVLAGRVHAEF